MNKVDRRGVSAFALKVAAIAGMTACHVGVLARELLPWWAYCLCEALGGLTFPIMAFLVSEGYRHTSNCRRYACRLAVFAVLAQVPYGIFFEPLELALGDQVVRLPFTGNALFTLLVGLGLVAGYDRMRNRPAFWAFAALGVAGSVLLDWGVLGPVMVLMGHVLDEGWRRRALPAVLAVAALGLPALGSVLAGDLSALPEALYAFVGGTASAALLLAYDGSRGRSLKWFFYAYYPLHIAIIGLTVRLFM